MFSLDVMRKEGIQLFMALESDALKSAVVEALLEKKGEDVVVLNLKGICSWTDYFVIATGNSENHMRTLALHVKETLERLDPEIQIFVEGLDSPNWTLVDLGDLVVHIFSFEGRTFYDIERIWKDAPREKLH